SSMPPPPVSPPFPYTTLFRSNFLYYTARLYYGSHPEERAARNAEEEERGITTIEPEAGVDVAVQIIELNRLRPEDFDPRLRALRSEEHTSELQSRENLVCRLL